MTGRFYEAVSIAALEDGFIVKLDAHELKTPAKRQMLLPTRQLAQLVADEWAAQGDEIDSTKMLYMRLVSTALDRVQAMPHETAAAFAAYGMSDLLCYRADAPERLVARQAAAWDPLLTWAQSRFDMSFEVTDGVLPVSQPPANEQRLISIAGTDVFRLTGLAHLAALLGSALVTLALEAGHIDAQQAYKAAFLDDLFQIEEWGKDAEAEMRLNKIELEIAEAAGYLSALQGATTEEAHA